MRKLWTHPAAVLLVLLILVLMRVQTPLNRELSKTLDSLEKAGPADLSLIVYTDLHYDPEKPEPSTLLPMMNIFRRLTAAAEKIGLPIDALWNLGDLINGHTTSREQAADQIRTITAAENQVSANIHRIIGNHDDNQSSSYQPENGFPVDNRLYPEDLSTLLANPFSAQPEIINPLRPTDYYVDFNTVRVICLSAEGTTFLPETVSWLRSSALATEKEVLFLSHIPTRPEWGFRNDVTGGAEIESAVLNFIRNGGTVIAWLHGHDHGDMVSQVLLEDGTVAWSEISIGCARFQFPTSNGTPGMTYRPRNEQDETLLLFDLVLINQQQREVRLIRFGAGEDRLIRY